MRALAAILLCAISAFAAGELSGRRAPGFSLSDTSGKQHDPQDYRGKIVLVEFMQSTCPHCAGFSEILEQINQKYAGKVVVLSIAVFPDKPGDVMNFVAAHKIRYPMMFDCGQVTASYYKATPQKPTVNFPHLFIIDAQGIIRNDYGYDMLTRDIFEGKGLFRELDRMLNPAAAGKK